MYKILICVMIFISSEICSGKDPVTDSTELVLAYMVHRHGDRTPLQDKLSFTTDPEKVLELTLKYGFGQLTEKGKKRGYELGKFIRRRYNAHLSEQYNSSEIYIRSTDSTRTKMTVLSAMAAVYQARQDNWSKKINWTPVPYTTLPAKYDSMLAYVNCPVYIKALTSMSVQSATNLEKYSTLLEELSAIYGYEQTPAKLHIINDALVSQLSLGVPIPASMERLLPELEEGASAAMDVLFGKKNYLAFQSGVMLQGFFDAADDILSGDDVPRIQVFSGHNANVSPFSAVSKIRPRIGVPKYGSLFSLELRRNVQTGQYIVVPVFLEQPGAKEKYLQVDGCEGFCDLDSFRLLTSEYVLNVTEWRTLCEFNEDDDYDTSSID